MSTKAIREVLDWVEASFGKDQEAVHDARAEVESIERAAKEFANWRPEYLMWGGPANLIKAIAKQEP